MALDVQSALTGALVTIAVMTSLLLRRRGRRTDLVFAALCVNLILWFLADFFAGVLEGAIWPRLELAVAALIPVGLIRLFTELMPGAASRGRRLLATVYPLAAVSAAAALSPVGASTLVRYAVGGFTVLSILLGARAMAQSTNQELQVERARRRYLSIGAAIAAIASGLSALHGSSASLGHVGVMFYVFFLSQVIARERLLDLNEFVGRMAVLGVLVILFASICALLISIATTGPGRVFNATVAVVIAITLYDPLRARLDAKMAEFFFRERNRFQSELNALKERMQLGFLDPLQMSRRLVTGLYATRRPTHVAMYLLERGGGAFVRAAHEGPEPIPRVSARDLPALYQAIHQARQAIVFDEAPRAVGEDEPLLQNAMRAVSADAIFPLRSRDEVLGFLALRDDRSAEPFASSELAQLQQLANTAAVIVWNSKLSEELRERERLAAIGSMAAGLAHEIRNPLGAIKGAAEYLDPSRFPKAEEGEFLQVIIEETNRLNSVVSQFLDYARPFQPNLQLTDLNEVIRRTVLLIGADARKDVGVDLDLDPDLPQVHADKEQLRQVILNLILNAMDASRGTGTSVLIRTESSPRGSGVELMVRDRGVGIPDEALQKIFIPFFTTKQGGTGLGLAVCQRIVLAHSGRISVRSALGEGSEFAIELPLQPRETAA